LVTVRHNVPVQIVCTPMCNVGTLWLTSERLPISDNFTNKHLTLRVGNTIGVYGPW